MNPIILELSRDNSNDKNDDIKSVWSNNVKEPIIINEGDMISIKNCFINVEQQESTDIVIEEPGLHVSLSFGYYEYNTDFTGKTNSSTAPSSGPGGPDFEPYVAFVEDSNYAKLNTVYLDLATLEGKKPKTTHCSVAFGWQDKSGAHLTTGDSPVKITIPDEGVSIDFPVDLSGDSRFDEVVVGSIKFLGGDNLPYFTALSKKDPVYVNPQAGGPQLLIGTASVVIEPGTYDPISLSKTLSDKFQLLNPNGFSGGAKFESTTELLIRTDSGTNFTMNKVGTLPSNTSSNIGYKYSDGTNKTKYWLGASQMSFAYGSQAGLGDVFAIEYMHTPWIDHKELSVRMFKPTGGSFQLIPQQCGIFLVNVSPQPFFESLGFNIDDLLVNLTAGPDPANIKYVGTKAELDRVTTKQYSGIQSLFPDGTRAINDTVPGNGYIDSTSTIMLLGRERNLDATGHYLIELTFNSTGQQFVFNSGSLSHIFGIVSRQYLQDGYVTSFSDAGIDYIHSGKAFNLQNIRVRILDPSTKQAVDGLGDKTSIYLQINKQLQIAQKEK